MQDQGLPSSSQRPTSSQNASNDRSILERISTLLSHYWTADEHPAMREAQLAEWLDPGIGDPFRYLAAVECCQQVVGMREAKRERQAEIKPPERLRFQFFAISSFSLPMPFRRWATTKQRSSAEADLLPRA